MEITVGEKKDDVTTISLEGSLDASTSSELKDVVTDLMGKDNHFFVVDLEKVDFIDSSGLGCLVGLFKKSRIGKGDVKLSNMSESILKIFQITHLDRVFTIVDGNESN